MSLENWSERAQSSLTTGFSGDLIHHIPLGRAEASAFWVITNAQVPARCFPDTRWRVALIQAPASSFAVTTASDFFWRWCSCSGPSRSLLAYPAPQRFYATAPASTISPLARFPAAFLALHRAFARTIRVYPGTVPPPPPPVPSPGVVRSAPAFPALRLFPPLMALTLRCNTCANFGGDRVLPVVSVAPSSHSYSKRYIYE
ncbi:hypothetical protein B0H13DRAFT_2318080 [Mycena leptocephala]|nr:hypothetical protein B0H13DRAFT_2318080 [Mycena leptocephala]